MSHPLDHQPEIRADMDLTGEPTHQCVCGNQFFKIVAKFEDYEIAMYSTTGECIECGSRLTVPTLIDNPEHTP